MLTFANLRLISASGSPGSNSSTVALECSIESRERRWSERNGVRKKRARFKAVICNRKSMSFVSTDNNYSHESYIFTNVLFIRLTPAAVQM